VAHGICVPLSVSVGTGIVFDGCCVVGA